VCVLKTFEKNSILHCIYDIFVIGDTICNLKSWILYQTKALTIFFKMRPHSTSNSKTCAHNEWFSKLNLIVVVYQ
jgi:hypothetical protein